MLIVSYRLRHVPTSLTTQALLNDSMGEGSESAHHLFYLEQFREGYPSLEAYTKQKA